MSFDNVSPIEIIEDKKNFLYIWIDILGFREGLKEDKAEIYERLFYIRKEFINLFSNDELQYVEIISISDGLLLIWDLNSLDLSKIIFIFEKLGRLQVNFILKEGYVLRGGIAVGGVSNNLLNNEKIKDVFLISNGFLKAYSLESKEVNWPIIATEENEVEKIKEILRIDNNEEKFGLEKVNGYKNMYLYMVDFLKFLKEDERKDFEIFLDRRLSLYYDEQKKNIFDKYFWLLNYYKIKFNGFLLPHFSKYYDGVLI